MYFNRLSKTVGKYECHKSEQMTDGSGYFKCGPEMTSSLNLFIDKVAKEKNLTRDEVAQSDDMALFYQHFLKRNYSKHITYNWKWYKKNLELLYLSAKANVSKVKRIFRILL
ncbi:hypothetical protein AVEN_107397-1 [Araneus ventricosus]|uniref:Uncharacterized protein n=1 Tax=Araneus ventricosus TaxID=182803 RepID=A0A4Y2X5G6_ARAVE|nr:hypothetical protein AVEN_107397-1 [Araneus ventricosus]